MGIWFIVVVLGNFIVGCVGGMIENFFYVMIFCIVVLIVGVFGVLLFVFSLMF